MCWKTIFLCRYLFLGVQEDIAFNLNVLLKLGIILRWSSHFLSDTFSLVSEISRGWGKLIDFHLFKSRQKALISSLVLRALLKLSVPIPDFWVTTKLGIPKIFQSLCQNYIIITINTLRSYLDGGLRCQAPNRINGLWPVTDCQSTVKKPPFWSLSNIALPVLQVLKGIMPAPPHGSRYPLHKQNIGTSIL